MKDFIIDNSFPCDWKTLKRPLFNFNYIDSFSRTSSVKMQLTMKCVLLNDPQKLLTEKNTQNPQSVCKKNGHKKDSPPAFLATFSWLIYISQTHYTNVNKFSGNHSSWSVVYI